LSYLQCFKWVDLYLSLNFGEKIPLSDNEAPGSFIVIYKNISTSTIRYQLNTAILYDGTCIIFKNSSAIVQTTILSTNDNINSL
jgi:hypothetical protein